jgi:hypothetical protein
MRWLRMLSYAFGALGPTSRPEYASPAPTAYLRPEICDSSSPTTLMLIRWSDFRSEVGQI